MHSQINFDCKKGITPMNRFVIMTVGKTHSGKTTFARKLEKVITNSVVIDQDNHAEFLQSTYPLLVPTKGHNKIKYALTQTIVDYAVKETSCHLILCNSNRNRKARINLLEYFQNKGFTTMIVNFDMPDDVLFERVETSQRSTEVLRTVLSFKDVLERQHNESGINEIVDPVDGEADYFYIIRNSKEVEAVTQEIVKSLHSED